LLNMVFGFVSFGCVRCLRYTLPNGCAVATHSLGEWRESAEGVPDLLWGRSPHLEEALERILGRRACVRRAWVY
jgi:hypothetical protein